MLGDIQGQAAASNYIGVNYMYLTCGANEGMLHASFVNEADSAKNMSSAIDYHERHLRLADMGGNLFISCCSHRSLNANACLYTFCRPIRSSDQFRYLLRYSEKRNSGDFLLSTNELNFVYNRHKTYQSAKCHQDALRLAIKMQSVRGQAISVGNLGMLALLKADSSTAITCFEQVSAIFSKLALSQYNILYI